MIVKIIEEINEKTHLRISLYIIYMTNPVQKDSKILCKCGVKYKIKNKEKHEESEAHKKFLLNQFKVYFE
ncbi:MAG: hypothetical protein JSS98_20245 [Bacteroidetes bacterium]|nr:hypothetical protein [Bacteroidota bacterium]